MNDYEYLMGMASGAETAIGHTDIGRTHVERLRAMAEKLRQFENKSWHSGPPKEPGWYWTMWRGCRGPEAVKVIYTDRPELPGQVWYGPITVPPWLEHHPGDLPSEPPKPGGDFRVPVVVDHLDTPAGAELRKLETPPSEECSKP